MASLSAISSRPIILGEDPKRIAYPCKLGKYEVQKCLGEGAFSNIYLVKRKLHEWFAMKVPKHQSRVHAIELRAYQAIQQNGGHPFVISLIDRFKYRESCTCLDNPRGRIPDVYCFVVPFLSRTLREHMNSGRSFTLQATQRVFFQTISALAFLKNRCLLEHGDVKPDNVMWNKHSQTITLIDFTNTYTQKELDSLDDDVQTAWYRHPVAHYTMNLWNKNIDGFSAGLISLELYSSENPYKIEVKTDKKTQKTYLISRINYSQVGIYQMGPPPEDVVRESFTIHPSRQLLAREPQHHFKLEPTIAATKLWSQIMLDSAKDYNDSADEVINFNGTLAKVFQWSSAPYGEILRDAHPSHLEPIIEPFHFYDLDPSIDYSAESPSSSSSSSSNPTKRKLRPRNEQGRFKILKT